MNFLSILYCKSRNYHARRASHVVHFKQGFQVTEYIIYEQFLINICYLPYIFISILIGLTILCIIFDILIE